MFILIFWLSAAWGRAQPGNDEKISPNVTQVNGGVTNVKFSPSGKLMIIQMDTGFYLFPIKRLEEVIANLGDFDNLWTEGQAKDFLPLSEKVVFAPRRGLYALNPQTLKTEPIYQMTAEDEEKGNYLSDGEMVAVSENLIVSGDGEYDIGLEKGNILHFNVRGGRVKRGARINGFRYAYLSPSRKYIVFDHAGEQNINADLYDVGRDINTPIPKRFNFKRHFPKYKKTNIDLLGWFGANRFAATVDEDQFDEYETKNFNDVKDTPAWLVMFDATAWKIVWKRQLNDINAPVHLEQLSQTKAFFYGGDSGRYEVTLDNGTLTKLTNIKGTGFSFSSDKTQMAFFDDRRVFVSSANGADKKLAVEIPENRENTSVTNKGTTWINWSPDGKRLFVFDQMRLLIVTL